MKKYANMFNTKGKYSVKVPWSTPPVNLCYREITVCLTMQQH